MAGSRLSQNGAVPAYGVSIGCFKPAPDEQKPFVTGPGAKPAKYTSANPSVGDLIDLWEAEEAKRAA
ncbi:MAG: hypothetical protein ACLQMT_06975 [Candidatus Acidiferrales bacterium]